MEEPLSVSYGAASHCSIPMQWYSYSHGRRRLSCPEGGTQTSVKNARTHFEGAQTTAIAFHLSRRCRDDTCKNRRFGVYS